MRVASASLAAQLLIGHVHRALCVLNAVCRHAPCGHSNAAVQAVLLEHHSPDVSIGHARAVFAEPEERDIREMVVGVGRRAIVQAVRPNPVAAAHARHRGLGRLACASGQGVVVRWVVLVVFDYAPVWRLEHDHIHPAAIPHFHQAQLLADGVVPAVLCHGPAARSIPATRLQSSRCATVKQAMPVLAPPARTVAPALGNQLLVLRERLGKTRRVQPARAAQVAGIAQVIACGKVPGNLVAMNGGAAVGVLEGIALARHFHPANAHAGLRTECARASDVGF